MEIISVVGLLVASTLAESEQEPMIVRDDTVRIDDMANLEVTPVQCSEACPLLFRPICGGIVGGSQETFVNECHLKHRNCLNRTSKF